MNPQILEDAFERANFDRELAFKFFVIFSMFEHALKEVGFRQIAPNGDVHPGWDLFAHAISAQFNANATQELSNAVSCFLGNPPMKQVCRNDQLMFEPTSRPNISDTEWLSILIRRVRNNLFHGGKVNYQRPRDTALIQCAIIILESWVVLDRGVEAAIWQIQ